MNNINKTIIDLLIKNENITSYQISDITKVSTKTVYSRIKNINYSLEKNGGNIQTKMGNGFTLVIEDKSKFDLWYKREFSMSEEKVPTSQIERVNYLAKVLLLSTDFVKIDDLIDTLYVSRNTITNCLKRVEAMLETFNLVIERKPNYGIRVVGNEFDIRKCIVSIYYDNDQTNYIFEEDMKPFLEFIVSSLQIDNIDNKVYISEYSLKNLILHIYVSYLRLKNNMHLIIDEKNKKKLIDNIKKESIVAAKRIMDKILETYKVAYSDDEILYLALHLDGKIDYDSTAMKEKNLIITTKIDALVIQMLDFINDDLGLDYRDNFELRMALCKHLIPFDTRIRYNCTLRNPLKKKIKTEYPLAYITAISACEVLTEYYGKAIPDDEIVYFATIFGLVTENKKNGHRKYNLVFACETGKGTAMLLVNKFKRLFAPYINTIYEISALDIARFEYEKLNIDYIFTVVPISCKVPVPVIEISTMLTGDDVNTYSEMMAEKDHRIIFEYFDEDLFLPHIKASNKKDVLLLMCQYLEKFVDLPDNYYDMVMKREEGVTDFGNLIALPHAFKLVTQQRFVMCGILDEPIFWGHNDVQLVFLTSFCDDEDKTNAEFLRLITNYYSSKELVKNTLENQTFMNLLEQLKKANY